MPQKKWYRSRRLWRVVFALLLAAGGLAGLVAWRFRQIASTGELAKILCERLAVELGMPVTVKSAEVHGLTQVDAKELRMLAPEGEMPIEAAQLSITFDGWSLLQGTLEPLTFELETLELDVTTPKKLVELKKTLERIQRQPHHFHPTILVTLARVATEQGRFTGDRLSLERPKYGNRGFRAQGVFEPAAADPVALQLRGVYTALPDSISGSLSLKSPWLEAYADGGITGATTHPQLKTAVRLDRLDLAVAAQKLGGQGRAIQGGVLSGRVTLTGEPGAPVVEGDLAPQDLALELPEVGLATVRSGRFDLGPGQALCREMVVETKFGVFGVEGALRAPASDPTLSLRASCASFDLTPLLEKRRLPATIEGGCSAVIGVEGHATRPVVRAELGVRGLDIEWPNEKVGPIPIRVLLATVLYSADALKASGADVTVWGVPATGDISIDDLSGGMKISAEVRAPDVDLGRLAKRLPPVVKRALELYRVQGRTAVTAQVSGVRGDYSVVLEGGAAGLELAVPLAQQWLPVKLSSGRVTLSRQTLFGSRLEGMVSGTPFTGEVAIANLLDAPSVTGEAVLRKARVEKLMPAVVRKYDLRGAPDLRVVLSASKDAPYEVTASARGLGFTLPLESGTKIPLTFEAGELRLARGTLEGHKLAGAVAGGVFRGEVAIHDALGARPRAAGKASMDRVWLDKLLPEVARAYSLEGPVGAAIQFDAGRVVLACNLAGLRTRVPAGKSFVTLEFQGGRVDVSDAGARMSQVVLTLGGKGRIALDGDATRERMDLAVSARGLEVGRLMAAAGGGEGQSKRPLSFTGRIRTAHLQPVLSGKFELGADPTATTTAAHLLDGTSGEITWDGMTLKSQKLKVLGMPASFEYERASDGSQLRFEMKGADLDAMLARTGAYGGMASGTLEASLVARTEGANDQGLTGRGHVVLHDLIVHGEKVAAAAGIKNPSTKMRGGAGFLALGFLPSFLTLPGQVAAGSLHMNAAYVDFAFGDHALGALRWEMKLARGKLEGPLTTSPNPEHVGGRLGYDVLSGSAEGSFMVADRKNGVSMKVNPLMLDTRRTPAVWTPDGLKDFEFSGAGDAFNIVGTAGTAVLGGILRGGSAALGPASLVPMLFMGDKKPHKPFTGKPGERPSSAESTVRTTAEMDNRSRGK